MNRWNSSRNWLLICILVLVFEPIRTAAENASISNLRDGQHDFDFNIGTWKTHIRYLRQPPTGPSWVEYDGTVAVRKIWNGRGQLEEIEADGSAGHFEGLTLFLYNPESHQWSQNFANSNNGMFNMPSIGEFKNGRGEFYSQSTYLGRSALIRGVWSDITSNGHQFEQSYSFDGGRTWEPNFIATLAQASEAQTAPPMAGEEQAGLHDFDFNFGIWKTHVSRLLQPLSGSTTWAQYDGTSNVSKVWNGRASMFELEVDGPAGHIEGVGLRLYNPQSHQWSLNWASSRDGTLQPPMVGEFKDGRGEFYDRETLNGRVISDRNGFSDITPDSSRFVQEFSNDGGKTWEANWIMTFTRANDESGVSGPTLRATSSQQDPSARDGQHDFDWEIGTWKVHVSRLLNPLTGSKSWIEMDGTIRARKVWDGRANLAEVELEGPTGHIEFLALRLYNPQSRQWSISFATSGVGTLSVPLMGEFKDGRGEFYDQEPHKGRTILVRFVFTTISPDSGRSEQSFSDDGGKTWEVNWINNYTRVREEPSRAE